MSVLVGKKSRVVVQGITGGEGTFHTSQMLAYGTNVVASVTPGKGGQKYRENEKDVFPREVPVFNTVAEAVKATRADVSIIFVPAAFVANLRGVSRPLFGQDLTVSWLLDHLRTITWNFLYEWDLVFVGGYFQWGLSVGAWAALWWMLRKQKAPAGTCAVFVLVSLLSAAVVILNIRYFGWYWFSLILFQVARIERVIVYAKD